MNKNKITIDEVEAILAASEIDVYTVHDKCTVVSCKLPNGFVLVESSGAVDVNNYSEEVGEAICLAKIRDSIWKLEGYHLANHLYHARKALESVK
jgi:hypothetical protein